MKNYRYRDTLLLVLATAIFCYWMLAEHIRLSNPHAGPLRVSAGLTYE